MSSVLPFRRDRREPVWDRADAEWFARNSDRRFSIRRATETEDAQGRCHHGSPPAGAVFIMAVHMVGPGFLARRFLVGPLLDTGEEIARRAFERALIAGEPPRKRDLHPEPHEHGSAA